MRMYGAILAKKHTRFSSALVQGIFKYIHKTPELLDRDGKPGQIKT